MQPFQHDFDFGVFYNNIKDTSWPDCDSLAEFDSLPEHIKKECIEIHGLHKYTSDAGIGIIDNRIIVPWLEWHAAHACNFSCENCGHLSNHGISGIITVDQLQDWFGPWIGRIIPKRLSILGGEPLLNKQILDIIMMSRDQWHSCPGQVFELVTNGFLLDRYPALPKILADTDCQLHITYHGPAEKYDVKFQTVIQLVREWERKWGITVKISGDTKDNEEPMWRRIFNGFGSRMMPFKDNDPESSWNNCPTGQKCFQLVDAKIYKCAPLAYLPLVKKQYKLSSEWDQYLSYQPLLPDCSDQEIVDFYNRKAESYCGMCPSKPMRFRKKNPLIPVSYYKKNIDDSAEPITYDK